jgi:hypothetical protein
MKQVDILKNRQARLKEDIAAMLDSYLIGSIASPPSLAGHNLTTKVDGKTVTLYVRKNLVPMAMEMSMRYKKMWLLMQKLSKVNWEILKLENE